MLTEIINQYITEKRAEQIRSHDKFRVSDAGRCHLMRYWKRKGKPFTDEPDARTQRVFEVGHIFHIWLQDLLKEKGLLIEKEMVVEDFHRRGHIDALVQTSDGIVVYDFKTVHSRKFHYRRNGEVDLHYALQAFTYARMLPCLVGVDDVRIAYISKDDLCIDEVSIFDMWSETELMNLYAGDWTPLFEAWERQEEPATTAADWECKYCIYRSSCDRRAQ